MRVEEWRAEEAGAQQGVYDVADGAIVREADPLGRLHENAAAAAEVRQRGHLGRRGEGGGYPRAAEAAHLAQGFIFRARPRLRQNPAPPVANQKRTCAGTQNTRRATSALLGGAEVFRYTGQE